MFVCVVLEQEAFDTAAKQGTIPGMPFPDAEEEAAMLQAVEDAVSVGVDANLAQSVFQKSLFLTSQ